MDRECRVSVDELSHNSWNESKEWLRGYEDCAKGIPHKDGEGDEYDAGYSDCYQSEQIENHVPRMRRARSE